MLGGDLTGRQVIFGNDGKTGVVVVHRPPLIFVYKDSSNDGSVESAIEGAITVLDNLYPIDIPRNLRRVDSFGRRTTLETEDTNTETKNLVRPIFAPIPQVKDIAHVIVVNVRLRPRE